MAITPINNHYIIDMSSNNNFVQVPAMQGDGNRVRGIEIELIQNNVPYVLNSNEIIVVIAGTKPDTKHILNSCDITDEGYILVDITSEMTAVAGCGHYQIMLMDMKTNSQLKSFPFHIITTPSAFDIDYIISSDEFQLLTETISKALEDYTYVIENAQASANLSKSYAVGDTGVRDGENTDNSKYYSEQANTSASSAKTHMDNAKKYMNNASTYMNTAKSYAIGGTGTRENENIDNSRYYSEQASKSASTATIQANNASTSATLSKSYAVGGTGTRDGENTDNAMFYCDETKNSALDAKTYMNTAKSYAIGGTKTRDDEDTDNSKYYCEEANSNASNAETYMNTAKSYAVGKTGTRINEDTDNSMFYCDEAKNNALAAFLSQQNANSSETNAKTYMEDSQSSANLSMSYAIGNTGTRENENKDNSKYYSQQSSKFASEAEISKTSANQSAQTATEQATIAANAATSILGTEKSVNKKAEETLNYSNLAKSYAVGTDNVVRNNDSVDNAKYYYEQVKGISEGLNGGLLPMGTITFANLEKQTKQAGYMYNISNSFVTTDTFKEGAGYTYPAGTNVYYTADGYWDCFAGTMVTSVNGQKGDIILDFICEITSDSEPIGQNIGSYWVIESEL